MARLLVIGASSGVGLETAKAALAGGHAVRAFSRSASKLALDDPFLEKVDGDALNATDVRAALAGCDAVVQSLGVPLTPQTVLSGTRLFSSATRVLVDAMQAIGPRRLIVVTGVGSGDSRDALGPAYRAAFELSLRRIYDDKDAQEIMVKRSGLDWTLVRPGFLTNGPAGSWRALVQPSDWRAGSVSRAAVAAFIMAHWNDPAFRSQAPVLIAA
jgi:putative NADH-flavin reductase